MHMKYVTSFLTLYEEQNISKASAKLYITQQGLSRQLQALEHELGVLLFERSKQGLAPTAICTSLYPVLQRMHGEYERAMGILEEHRKRAGASITIAFAQGISNSGSPEFLFDYQKMHPEVGIEIIENTQPICIQKLLNREVNLAFLVNPIDKSLLQAVPLSQGDMYAAMHKSHPLALGKAPIDFALLDGENIITGSTENALRGMFDYFCRLTNIRPHVIVSSNYSLDYVNAMTENTGIATVTSTMALRITNPDIRIHRLLTPESGCLYCCTPKNADPDREVSALLAFIRRHFEQEPILKLEGL
ncbi:MAG: LysR family transcriptional regulator [Clostridiales bacterium]|nr:LysR family transcriptional regulator [Clostridiales bacterium]